MSKEIVGGFIILILVYLLVNNGQNTNSVIKALAGGLTSVTAALQGRNSIGVG